MMHQALNNKDSKVIKSLQQKKYRDQFALFVVEGVKLVGEALIAGHIPHYLVFTGSADDYPYPLPAYAFRADLKTFGQLSSLKSPQGILAVFEKPEVTPEPPLGKPLFALDGVSDPGNMGTILRISDWFGMPYLVCGVHCVDIYNPKVVQASMGSVFRVKVAYVNLPQWLAQQAPFRQIYGAHMHGEPVYGYPFGESPVMVLGSEAHGISKEVSLEVGHYINIPKRGGGESLNVAMSAAIVAPWLSKAV